MWYVADKPTGPWAATADVPAAVYEIPPSSPSYPVTQVIVQTTDDGDVESSYDGAYAAGMFVAFGVAYYGTGWYYPPYYYGGYYYPYYGSYGHGSWYNPNTGGFGSRSVYYGPYGGYSYNQGYNPKTGRHGYVETAWDGDEWASSGGTYNPRTGISTETDRHYSEDSNKMKMERTVEGPGGREMDVKKTTDFDTGTRTTERKTDRGGSSEVTRQRQAGGGYTTDGSFETAGGKSGTISGEHKGGQGSTTITGEGGASAIDGAGNAGRRRREARRRASPARTARPSTPIRAATGDRSVTKAEGSGGGSAVSVGQRRQSHDDRESGSGDIYAGHDGNVYRKTDDGWQQHGDGGWSDVDTPDRPAMARGRAATCRATSSTRRALTARGPGRAALRRLREPRVARHPGRLRRRESWHRWNRARPATSNTQQLNRDAAARSGGYQNYQRRTAPRSSGMSRGGGARPRRR